VNRLSWFQFKTSRLLKQPQAVDRQGFNCARVGSAGNSNDTPKFDSTPVNLNDALKEARENRPELRRLRLQNDINKIDLQYYKNQTKPQIDIQSTFATTGLAVHLCRVLILTRACRCFRHEI
jgi:hypothetical protein